jgi:hypothetical protein
MRRDKIMDNYIGCKIIRAELINLEKYKCKKYGQFAKIAVGDNLIEGYVIIYPPIGDEKEPYISWSPKAIFEKCYRKIENAEISLINGFFSE